MTSQTQDAQRTTTGKAAAWKTWQDWVNLVAGVLLALTPLLAEYGSASGWAITLGIIIAVVALWALATASSKASEWVQVVAGVVAFITPWIGSFSTDSGAWWTWVLSVIVVIAAVWALAGDTSEK